MSNRELTYARLHTTIFAPGLGQLGPELTATTVGTRRIVKLTVEDQVVVCEAENEGRKYTVLIPVANFTNMIVSNNAQGNKA